MMSTQATLQNPLYRNSQVAPVKVVAAANQAGSYLNGPTNNGVGATFTYAAGALSIDSVVLNLNDYVLLAGQTLGYQNGIYQLTVLGNASVGAVLTRRPDYQNIEQIRTGFYTAVYAGSVYGGSFWTLVEPEPQAIGVPAVANANNLNFANAASESAGAYLAVANNLSELAASPAAQAASLANLGLHAAKATGAGGSATVTITDAKITAASVVVLSIQSSANAVSVEKVTPGAGSLTVLLSADPGANVLAYHSTSAVE